MGVSKERIGILGGTFHPIHQGHLGMALAAMDTASLDRVLMLPDSVPPHKTNIAPAEDRWRMLVAATAGIKGLEPCRLELDREGTTYTYDTLVHLHEAFPKADLYYIIGADTLMQLHSWHRSEEVLGLCTFLVCPRACETPAAEMGAERKRLTALGGRFLSVNMDPINVSSTELRSALAEDRPTPLLPVTVREYCSLLGLCGAQARIPEAAAWMPRLFADLNARRYAHTLGVAHSARALARNHGVDQRKAEIAALLHDCAKCLPLKEMQRIATENQLTRDPSVLSSGALLHAVAGAWMAEHVYGVSDPEILHAIAVHTTGAPVMSKLDMVVCLADKIEPGRETYPLLAKVRMMAPLSLERALTATLEGTVSYVEKGGKALHPETLQTLEWLRKNTESNGGGASAAESLSK